MILLGVGALVIVLLALNFAASSRQAAHFSLTLRADRVEWTDLRGREFSVKNSDLETFPSQYGFRIGANNGPIMLLNTSLEDFKSVVVELKRRAGD